MSVHSSGISASVVTSHIFQTNYHAQNSSLRGTGADRRRRCRPSTYTLHVPPSQQLHDPQSPAAGVQVEGRPRRLGQRGPAHPTLALWVALLVALHTPIHQARVSVPRPLPAETDSNGHMLSLCKRLAWDVAARCKVHPTHPSPAPGPPRAAPAPVPSRDCFHARRRGVMSRATDSKASPARSRASASSPNGRVSCDERQAEWMTSKAYLHLHVTPPHPVPSLPAFDA